MEVILAIKKGNKYLCPICRKTFDSSIEADTHRDDEHHVIFLPISLEMINRLLQFIYTKDESLLEPELILLLQNYSKIAQQRMFKNDLSVL